MTKVTIDRELLERAATMELDTTARSIRIQDELRAILAQPAQQGEAVEVRGLQWLDTGHYRKKPPQFGYNPHDWNPLMTVAQHQRILAASVPAGCKVVKVELLKLLHEMVDLHERHGTVLTVHMEQLRAILGAENE